MDMTFMLAAYGAAGVTLLLIVAGRVAVREYFKRKAAEKQAEIEALAKELAAKQLAEEKARGYVMDVNGSLVTAEK
ncbi:hypothetical protein [Cronobacter malonaticus]|uniref:hypothetical protein n=1 Tax=Cronobacter malonaticus TaxID=413503 RepID=UPI000CFF2639|nr:hypothetical protein [Cronobacter malonaticus]